MYLRLVRSGNKRFARRAQIQGYGLRLHGRSGWYACRFPNWIERLTTVAADRSMMETGIRRENRKEFVDEIAAIFILQGYLDYLSNSRS